MSMNFKLINLTSMNFELINLKLVVLFVAFSCFLSLMNFKLINLMSINLKLVVFLYFLVLFSAFLCFLVLFCTCEILSEKKNKKVKTDLNNLIYITARIKVDSAAHTKTGRS